MHALYESAPEGRFLPPPADGKQPPPPTHRLEPLLPLKEVLGLTTLSKRVVYKMIKAGTFPRPIAISENRVAWRASAVARWMSERPMAGIADAA